MKSEVERPVAGGREGVEGLEGGPDQHVDRVVEAGVGEVLARHVGVVSVELEGRHPAARREPPGEVDRRVAAERADLEDRRGPDGRDEELQQPPLERGDLDGRQPARRRRRLSAWSSASSLGCDDRREDGVDLLEARWCHATRDGRRASDGKHGYVASADPR